nr:zinc finger protein 862-like [Onthophagus taurus]
MSGGKEEIPDDLKPLLNVIASIPISTSECERNFSSMNEIVTPLRSSLSVETTAALLFINCVGPPLTQFNPEKYVRSWLAKGRHSADNSASRK